MKLSHEHLNKFKSAEYQEYKSRRRRSKFIKFLAGTFTFVFFLSFTIFAINILVYFGKTSGYKDIFLCLIFPSFILIISLGSYVGENFNKIFNHLAAKSTKYIRLKELQEFFDQTQWDLGNQVFNYINYGDLKNLIKEIEQNSEDSAIYRKSIDILLFNHNFVHEAIDYLDKYWNYWEIDAKNLAGIRKELNRRFRYKKQNLLTSYEQMLRKNGLQLGYELEENEIRGKIKKDILNRIRDYTKQKIHHTPINTLGIDTNFRSKAKGKKIIKSKPKHIQPSDTKIEIEETDSNKLSHFPNKKPEIKEQLTLFESEKIPRANKKPKKQKLFKPRTIKASKKFWENLNKKRISIGEKGELLVLEYERKRLIREGGEDLVKHLEHSSVVQGDGLGYDILSIENGEEIYIEVKTTTGSFRSNLIFTKNEIDAMEYYGNHYYLYRVFRYDARNKTGKLRIFKGRDHIESVFNFNPHTFILEEK